MGADLPRIPLSRPIVKRYLAKYKELALPTFPYLHLPSYDIDEATRNLVFGGLKACPQHVGKQPLRHLSQFLFLHLLMFGASYDQQPDTALELYIESGRQLQAEIARQKLGTTNRRTVAIVQALLLRAAFGFGLCSGSVEFERSSMSHLCSAASLVNEMNLASTAGRPGREASEDDTSNIQWLCWVNDEERRRTIFTALGITSSAHFILDDAPSVDINAIDLYLPCHEALWEAQSAAEWHRRLPRFTHSKVPGFQEQLEKLFRSEERPTSEQQTPPQSAYQQDSSVTASIEPCTSEFGCLVLVCALNQLASKDYSAEIEVQYALDKSQPSSRSKLLGALVVWQSLWESFPRGSIPPSQQKLLTGCLPYLDHIHLLLRTNISCTKEALREREYDQLGQLESFCPILSDHNSRDELLGAATYAIDTLETTFKIIIGKHPNPLAAAIPHSVAVIMFHAVHIICNWILLSPGAAWTPATWSASSDTYGEDCVLQKCCNLVARYCASKGRGLYLDKCLGLKEASKLALHLLRLCAAIFDGMSEWGSFREMAKSFHVRAGSLEKFQQH
ncbi:hypothetical protein BDV24DRAFT_167641 [Aspergillus arachidicola]|uniref:Xylanolytic transcriptional activator regulatory domain-containing protein n=1 Tax=Aspergillus arachidicola TaxID=656916 RepID=A0A5N6XY07_9EURO|nr:hypothetical protein BDV24DRAFT_167641 [Aspergillus arachidicola]